MASKARAFCVKPEKVAEIWYYVGAYIRRAYERQPCHDTYDSLVEKLITGKALLWVAWDGEQFLGATVTEIWTTPTGKVCGLLATGGKNLNQWKHLLSRIEQFARDEGCYLMHFEGRKGWQRILPDYSTRIILEKRL